MLNEIAKKQNSEQEDVMKHYMLLCAGLSALAQLNTPGALHSEPQAMAAKTLRVGACQEVVRAAGPVEYSTGGEDWRALRVGLALESGATVRAGEGAEALLRDCRHGSFLRVTEGATLSLVPNEDRVLEDLGPAAARKEVVVRAVRGVVEVDRGQGWELLRVNEGLPPGAMLRTAAGGTADLFFRQPGLVLRVAPGSALRVGDGRKALAAGRMREQPLLIVLRGSVSSNTPEGNPNLRVAWRDVPAVFVGRR